MCHCLNYINSVNNIDTSFIRHLSGINFIQNTLSILSKNFKSISRNFDELLVLLSNNII